MMHEFVRRCAAPALSVVALVLGLVAVASGSANAAVPSMHAAKVSDRALFAGLKVSSSTHKSLHLSVSGDKYTKKADKPTVTLTARSGHETHSWTFKVGRSAIKTNHGSGHIKLTKAASHGFASVKLTFSKASSSKKTSCGNLTKSNVHGTIWLNTKSKGKHSWGKLGSTSHKISVKGAEDDLFTSCSGSAPCGSSKSWDTFSQTSNGAFLDGGTRGKHGDVTASRSVNLGKGDSRFDLITAKTAAPALHGSGKSAILVIGGTHSPAHGKLVIKSAAAPTTSKQKCVHKGKKTNEKVTSYNTATVTSHHFVVHADIFGSFKAPKQGFFSVTKF
jgi:hypothetical protein